MRRATPLWGFAGYNFQWSDALIGIELNYSHGEFGGLEHRLAGADRYV